MHCRLSSRSTFFHKVIMPTIWVLNSLLLLTMIAGGLSDSANYARDLIGAALFLPFWIIFGVVIYIGLVPLKAVQMDDDNLYVSNYRKKIRVPLAEVHEVNQSGRDGSGQIKIDFLIPTAFGKRVAFLPPTSWTGYRPLWPPSEWFKRREHPVVKQLRAAVARAKWLAAADSHAAEITGESPRVQPAPKARRSRAPRTDISGQGPGDIRKEDGER